MANQSPKPKKKDFFWLTVTVGACFVLLISILVGRFMGNYLVKTLPKAEAIKMPESVPLPKGYSSLTPYTLLSGTAQTGLTPTPSAQGTTPLTKTSETTKLTETKKAAEESPASEEETQKAQEPSEETAPAETKKPPAVQTTNTKTQTPASATTASTEPQKQTEMPAEAKTKDSVYRIQLGAFSTKENAQNLISDLKNKGFEGTVIPTKKDGKDYFRVQVGAYKNKESAEQIADDLKQKGYPVFISGQ